MLSSVGRGLACCLSSPSGHQEGCWRVDRPWWFGLTLGTCSLAADGACWPSYTESMTLSQVYLVFSAKPLMVWGSEPLLWALSTSLTCVLALLRSGTARSWGTQALVWQQSSPMWPLPVQCRLPGD